MERRHKPTRRVARKAAASTKGGAKSKPTVGAGGIEHRFEIVPIERLREWDENPRRNDAAAQRLAELIREHGFKDPIICSEDGVIRAGHTRLKAAKILGMREVPVIYVRFPDERTAQQYSIANNKASEWAEWDEAALKELLSGMPEWRCGGQTRRRLAVRTGFSERELDGLRETLVDYTAESFAHVATEFEQQHVTPKADGSQGWWAWMEFERKEDFDAVMELIGRGEGRRGRREIDTAELMRRLGLKRTGVRKKQRRTMPCRKARSSG